MDRCQNPRTHDKCAHDGITKGKDRKKDCPVLQTFAFFDDNCGMQKCRCKKPWHKGRVFNRVPEPKTAPAQFVIGPPTAQRDPDGQEHPCRQCPWTHPTPPCGINTSLDQGRNSKGKRHRKAHIPQIQKWGVKRQTWVLQQWVQILTVQGYGCHAQERV